MGKLETFSTFFHSTSIFIFPVLSRAFHGASCKLGNTKKKSKVH
jgi:hypothetical protein